ALVMTELVRQDRGELVGAEEGEQRQADVDPPPAPEPTTDLADARGRSVLQPDLLGRRDAASAGHLLHEGMEPRSLVARERRPSLGSLREPVARTDRPEDTRAGDERQPADEIDAWPRGGLGEGNPEERGGDPEAQAPEAQPERQREHCLADQRA